MKNKLMKVQMAEVTNLGWLWGFGYVGKCQSDL